ncbi:predicted xylanase/chitin deacetylase [Chthonomonas calidirosea]|uniref:Predicted xylanase/chitin deacetylase n=1 Tax=Chthonomonas calidirosea (strain DSM 23976 / ICMP 18418 / T49) TaxID=1303518 RepID=S0EUW9_CHTCT|nr:polysaccharide deacetylase family protein [Chthonomonas calidirosea]CCW34147.1 Predicted xylanase/chitin deacetylase [Chthonomonas calidirosea T49]CEK15624.1 predicted xylanase/chitin deacetylase [Chthonomonas calidirosea]
MRAFRYAVLWASICCLFVGLWLEVGAVRGELHHGVHRRELVQKKTPLLSEGMLPKPVPGAAKQFAAVLVWHDIVPKTKQVWFDTTLSTFRRQLELIHRGGFHVITLRQLYDHLTKGTPLPPKPIALTFDDNNQGIYYYAFPLLRRYGYPATLFVHTGYVGVTTDKRHNTWDMLRTMVQSGLIDVQSLTQSHPENILLLSDKQIVKELVNSRRSIELHLGIPVYAFVYPCDKHDLRVAEDVYRTGYEIAFTEDRGNACASPNLYLVHRYAAILCFDQALSDVAHAWH